MKYTIDKNHDKIILFYCDNINSNDKLEYKKLYDVLSKTKYEIDDYNKNWDKAKKIGHNYEYIYTSSNYKNNVCGVNPVASRSYFKILELLKDTGIDELFNDNILCIAEGPGGFLQYLNNIYKKNIYGITLLSQNKSIPYWSPIIINNKNIKLLKGIENDGDIYKLSNIESFLKDVDKCKLITSDGGIDYSNNYNNQELSSYRLLYCEIYLTLNLQKEGGNFIIKFFDIFYYNTLQLLYILYLCYDEIEIIKPKTSRLSNSEKYIVCKNYKQNNEVIDLMKKYFNNYDKLYIYIPKSFINDIEIYNTNYTNLQIKNIKYILNLNNLIENNYKKKINLAKDWCLDYNVDINPAFS